MRHGQKQDGVPNDMAKHTTEGAEQVRQSTRNNLMKVKFDALFRSDLYRTLELITFATGELPGQDKGLDVIAVQGFGYLGNPYLDQYYSYAEKLKAQCQKATVANWLREAPEMTDYAKAILLDSLAKEAIGAFHDQKILAANQDAMLPELNWLIGSHSPHCELLADDSCTPTLREADIIRYTLVVAEKMLIQHGEEMPYISMAITESQYIPRGF
jgi:hypothetical protein